MKTNHSNQTRFIALLTAVMMLQGTLALAQRTERTQSNTGRQVTPRQHQQPQRPTRLEARDKTKMPTTVQNERNQAQTEKKERVKNDFTLQKHQTRPSSNGTEPRMDERRPSNERGHGRVQAENRTRNIERTSRDTRSRNERLNIRKSDHKDFSMRHNRLGHDQGRHERSRSSEFYRRDRSNFDRQYGYNHYYDYYWQQNIPYWAPSYGYYSYTRHIYLPDYNCYYDLYRGYYMFFDGYAWYYSINTPWFLVDVDWMRIRQIELDDWYDDPFYYNDYDVIAYSGKNCRHDLRHAGMAYNQHHQSHQPINGYFKIEVDL